MNPYHKLHKLARALKRLAQRHTLRGDLRKAQIAALAARECGA